MTRTSDQVPPRPAEQLRADARQNHARLIAAATTAFAERGADAPLEDIARRAGVGIESELISSCWMAMRQTTERLLANAQGAGVIRTDVDAMDVMRLVHGVTVSTEKAPERSDMLLSVMLDGLRTHPA